MALTRLVVVGGGVIGTALAVEAVQRGHEVLQLERDAEPRAASVRNFGLIWICGRAAGRELELALAGHRRWLELSRRARGIGLRELGSLVVARNEAELGVLAAACERDDAARRQFTLLTPEESRRVVPALGDEIVGALHSPLDAVIEPAAALAALRALAAESGRYRFLPERTVLAVDGGAVDHRGDCHDADLVVVSTGDFLELVPTAVQQRARLSRRRLQMLETTPNGSALETAIADGDALRYYPAFDLPERERLPPAEPVVERLKAQLLVVPRADGGLTIGDTHVDDPGVPPGSDEEADDYLLRRAGELLPGVSLRVRRRWTGSYLRRADGADSVLIERTRADSLLVTAVGGMGMTAAPAIAAEALDSVGL